MIRVNTTVNLIDAEVEIELDDEMLAKALEAHDDPTRLIPDLKKIVEAVRDHFALLPPSEVPECVRQLVWVVAGRIL